MNNLGSHHSSAMPSDVRAPAYRPDSGLTARDHDSDPQAAPRCLVLLGGSERGGRNEAPEIEGKIPRELRGSLYRNGPGLFDRGGLRKPHLLGEFYAPSWTVRHLMGVFSPVGAQLRACDVDRARWSELIHRRSHASARLHQHRN